MAAADDDATVAAAVADADSGQIGGALEPSTIETEALGEPTNKRSRIETEALQPSTRSITTGIPLGPWRRRAFIGAAGGEGAARSDSPYCERPAAEGAAAAAEGDAAAETAVDATDGHGQSGLGSPSAAGVRGR